MGEFAKPVANKLSYVDAAPLKNSGISNRDKLKDKRLTRGDLSELRQPRGILVSNGASPVGYFYPTGPAVYD